MTQELNLDDIQGNVTRAYGKTSFPFARYFFLHIKDPKMGRLFLNEARKEITTAARWGEKTDNPKPVTTFNLALSWIGMIKLRISAKTLQGFPPEFIEGMRARAFVLGDRDNSVPEDPGEQGWCANWDKIWRENRVPGTIEEPTDVHMWVSINAQPKSAENLFEPNEQLETKTQWLRDLCSQTCAGGVQILSTNGVSGTDEYQAASAVFDKFGDVIMPTAKEHFGLTDGIGDPVFKGQFPADVERAKVRGRGKWMAADRGYEGWEPIATGEFILGHPDESQQLPPTTLPPEMMHNGTFMVYRKLHENVATFNQVVDEQAKSYASEMDISQEEAVETLKAKMVGRWTDGVPLSMVPSYAAWQDIRAARGFSDQDYASDPLQAAAAHRKYLGSAEAVNFKYGDDMKGFKCPATSHLRRANTRDYLDPKIDPNGLNPDATTQLNKRRRIMRRGLPYGPPNFEHKDDDTEQGVAMMILGASIFRQFEFVQQQWMQYGLDFNAGNNTCPLLGDHCRHDRHVIPEAPESGKPTHVMQLGKTKNFVETRGGEYFFIPSMTAIRMMAMGIIDPT